MKFDVIDQGVDSSLLDNINTRFHSLMLELGTRKDNYHIGSGRGGNPFQLLVMLDMKHHLSSSHNRTIYADLHSRQMVWGARWFLESAKDKLRDKLDEVFLTIPEHFKYRALALEQAATSNNLREVILNNQDQFPKIISCFRGEDYQVDLTLPLSDQLILASVLCQEFAYQLDSGNISGIEKYGKLMACFCPEIFLITVRRYIQIDRLIRFNLDESPTWSRCLNFINKTVDGK